jgi:phosphopantetheinyl transferase
MSALPHDVTLVSIAEIWAKRDTFLSALTERERAIFDAKRIEKKRRDFLAGRIAGKRAVQRAIGCPFSRIAILPSDDGARSGQPEVWIDGTLLPDLEISISHAGDLAAATTAKTRVGFDLETVAARDASFEALALTEAERRSLAGSEGPVRDRSVTRLWCRKEAIAKWTGVGFRAAFFDLALPDRASLEEGTFVFRGVEVCWARLSGGTIDGRD